jgi:hypothetical protein
VHREPEAGRALPFSLRPAPRRQREEKSRDISGINCRTNHCGRFEWPLAYPFRLGTRILGRYSQAIEREAHRHGRLPVVEDSIGPEQTYARGGW